MFPMQQGSIWDNLANADMPERGDWFQPDFDGEVKPLRTLAKQSQQNGSSLLIVECEIVKTNHEAHPEGKRFSWIQKLDNPQVAMGAIKQFVTAAVGMDPKDRDAVASMGPYYSQLMQSALADPANQAGQNELVRRVCHLTTRLMAKKRSAGMFTLHTWGPSTGQVGPWAAKQDPPVQSQAPVGVLAPPAWAHQGQAPQAPPFQAPQAPPFQAPQAPPFQAPQAPPGKLPWQ